MKRLRVFSLLMVSLALLLAAHLAFAQSYSFTLDEEIVNVYIQEDGTMRIDYNFVFTNDMSGPLMKFVDIGMHNNYYDLSKITATINGQPISHIAPSDYKEGAFELGLGSYAIQPGSTGRVDVTIWGVPNVLYIDSQDTEYASVKFSPTWFERNSVHGTTDLQVTFHLPPGVQPEEPKWHPPEGGWPTDEPYADYDSDGRIVYVWWNASANGYTQYTFGASFPKKYVPVDAVKAPSISQQIGIDDSVLGTLFVCGGGVLLFVAFVAFGIRRAQRRKLAYLPPKIAIEGHGIKRGLTAIEAAVLLETPLDRVMTMILFSLIKKNGARVVSEDPLKIERLEPQPKAIRPYEKTFLTAMVDTGARKRRPVLQKLMIALVKSVQKKMKGFSLRETRDYYKSIMRKAWQQVEDAETPEIRSKLFDEGLEWTMLDRDFDDRTERTFRTGPVFLPMWWGHYRPSYRPTVSEPSVARPSAAPGGRGVSIPRLPGSEFAASMVNGVQKTANSLVSNVTNFTNGVTKTTNPPPPPSSRSGGGWSSGGGSSCACACACAGCACACAGGGR